MVNIENGWEWLNLPIEIVNHRTSTTWVKKKAQVQFLGRANPSGFVSRWSTPKMDWNKRFSPLKWQLLKLGPSPSFGHIQISCMSCNVRYSLRKIPRIWPRIVHIPMIPQFLTLRHHLNRWSPRWWFGTWLDYDFPYIGNNDPNWRTHIFQRGWNHQPVTYLAVIHCAHRSLVSPGCRCELGQVLSSVRRSQHGRGIKLSTFAGEIFGHDGIRGTTLRIYIYII